MVLGLALFEYISITSTYSCLSLFIYKYKISSFFSFGSHNLLFFDKKTDV